MRRPVIVLLLALAGSAWAHPQLLFARLSSEPAVPQPAQGFDLRVSLSEPSGQEVPGLELLLLIYPQGAEVVGSGGEDAPEPLFEVPLVQVADTGSYRGRMPPLDEGEHPIRLVELVRGTVESNAAGALPVGTEELEMDLLLPPVAAGLGTWLVWLVGLPLVAGVLVTILIITGRGRPAEE